MEITRLNWENSLIKAQVNGLICDGALLVALKLAPEITWNSRRHPKPGLYWKNEEAFAKVGVSRSTYFRHKKQLFDQGFFKMEKGNLIPTIPKESQVETNQSQVETVESQVETQESQVDTPYSVDTYSVDIYSGDSYSVTTSGAEAPQGMTTEDSIGDIALTGVIPSSSTWAAGASGEYAAVPSWDSGTSSLLDQEW